MLEYYVWLMIFSIRLAMAKVKTKPDDKIIRKAIGCSSQTELKNRISGVVRRRAADWHIFISALTEGLACAAGRLSIS